MGFNRIRHFAQVDAVELVGCRHRGKRLDFRKSRHKVDLTAMSYIPSGFVPPQKPMDDALSESCDNCFPLPSPTAHARGKIECADAGNQRTPPWAGSFQDSTPKRNLASSYLRFYRRVRKSKQRCRPRVCSNIEAFGSRRDVDA